MKIKWIVGYVDSYGAIHHATVNFEDSIDSHNQIWPGPKQRKWRWIPETPNHLNTYGEELDPEEEDKVWQLIDLITK